MKHYLYISLVVFMTGCTKEPGEQADKRNSRELPQAEPRVNPDSVKQEEVYDWAPALDTNFFNSGSFLYWQINTDSSWLTFETKDGQQTALNWDYIGYWDKLGTIFRKEYDNYLFFIHRWISGCCTMPDFILLDQYTGEELRRIESDNAIFSNNVEDYLLYFKDSTMNEMIYLDMAADRTYRFDVKKFKLRETAVEQGLVNSAEFHWFIELPKIKNKEVTLVFDHVPKNEEGVYERDSIVFVKR